MPWASYQWTSARKILPSAKRTAALPFFFRYLPLPYAFHNRLLSRILVPVAIVSISVISPTTWKYMAPNRITATDDTANDYVMLTSVYVPYTWRRASQISPTVA